MPTTCRKWLERPAAMRLAASAAAVLPPDGRYQRGQKQDHDHTLLATPTSSGWVVHALSSYRG
jgi:hypothetical protein